MNTDQHRSKTIRFDFGLSTLSVFIGGSLRAIAAALLVYPKAGDQGRKASK
jgi:hypothetical protein